MAFLLVIQWTAGLYLYRGHNSGKQQQLRMANVKLGWLDYNNFEHELAIFVRKHNLNKHQPSTYRQWRSQRGLLR